MRPVFISSLLLLACPSLKTPEHGVELTFSAPAGADEVLERRLALLHVRARLRHDDEGVSVRLTDGSDVAGVKRALSMAGRVEICAVDLSVAAKWCSVPPSDAVKVEPVEEDEHACSLVSTDQAPLAKAAGALKGRPAFIHEPGSKWRTVPVTECFAPRFAEGATHLDEHLARRTIMLTMDEDDARRFEVFTNKQLHHQMIVLLDDSVVFAPLVESKIRGGKLVFMPSDQAEASADQLISAVVGGSLDGGLQVLSERRYGPPSLLGQ